RAWVVAARRRISTVDEAVAYAEVWRAVYEDSRKANVRRGLARRTAWRSVAEVSGGVWADLPRTAEVAAVDVVRRATPTEAAVANTQPSSHTAVADRQPPRGPALPAARDGNHQRAAQVRSFLAGHVGDWDYAYLDEADDPYLCWAT